MRCCLHNCIDSGDSCPDFTTFCPKVSDEALVALALEESVVVALEKLASMPPAKEAASLTGLLGTGSADGVLTICHAFDRVNGIVGIQIVVRCPKRPIEEVSDCCCCFCFVLFFSFSFSF